MTSIVVNGIRIREVAGREGVDGIQTDSASRAWLCTGSDDPLACRAALFAPTQTLFNLFEYDGLRLESLSRDRIGPEAWQFTGTYGRFPLKGQYEISIDTTGSVVRTTQAFLQSAFPASGETAIQYGTAIDVQGDEVRGVDVVIPALRLTVQARIDLAILTSPIAYAKLVAGMTGTTNAVEYLTFAPGELLFAGATGPINENRDPFLSFEFLASKNLENVNIGPIASVTKAGHDYAWVGYRKDRDGFGRTIQKPVAMYVARVYGQSNFNNLGIGELAAQTESV